MNVEPYRPLEKGKYFIEKSIFIISRHPFFDQFEKILYDLFQAILKEGIHGPLEDYVTRLLYQVPAPPRGIQQVTLKLSCK
jgi:hypothetical protein